MNVMVIIKRDDYISFLNATGVKMPITPANDNITAQPPGNVGSIIPPNNSSLLNQSATISTIKRDSSQQQLQQLQQYTQQQNQTTPNSNQAKAQLVCRPNSHPFPSRTFPLEPNKPVKIGRSIARTKVSDNNGIFDCKVLSRNHAELWYEEGKFYLKDTGSSNGTFINNQRLSQTCQISEPFEVSSGDIVQFGVDVMENSRKETHGCIVATLRLFLPDGRETKASQSTLVGATNTKITQMDLHRLNQYIQEALQREQNLETKLRNIQKKIDLVRKTSSASWQALVDEDRLLSRIDMLEKKLLCFSKPLTEDKLREEIMKLQNEKMLYQTSAKQALKKVYNERMEAIQKLGSIEGALNNTEDECSLLRDQLSKTQTHSEDTIQRLDAMQTQLDVKCTDYEEKMYKKETELKNLNSELNELQEKLGSYKRQSEIGDYESSQLVTNWLLKSDLKNIDGSDDIIKAICGDDDEEINLAKSLETNCSQIYSKMFALEKELDLLFTATNVNNNNNINNNNNDNNSSNNGSEVSLNLNDSSLTLTDFQSDHVPSVPTTMKDEESILHASTINPSQENSQQQRDDNQNNMNDVVVTNGGANASSDRIRVNLKQLLALYAKLKRQLVEFTEAKANEQSSYKAKCDEMSSQLMSLKLEIDSRPTQEDFDAKVQQCNTFRLELSNLAEQMSSNEKLIEKMQMELSEERNHQMAKMNLEERSAQTDVIESTNEVPATQDTSKVLAESRPSVEKQLISSSTEMPQSSTATTSTNTSIVSNETEDDDALNNHPKVLYEDELIVFKEKCTNLTAENVRLCREVDELRSNMSQFHNSWLHNFLLKYLVPVLIVFVAYVFYLLK